jgi:hypothetical protein
VQSDTHTKRRRCLPWLAVESRLQSGSTYDSVGGAWEDREAAVTLSARTDEYTVVMANDVFHDLVVAAQSGTRLLGILLPKDCTALYVGEKEGDGAGRQVRHAKSPREEKPRKTNR